MSELTKEQKALGAFLAAMQDCGHDGAKMRAAMLGALGIEFQPAASEPSSGERASIERMVHDFPALSEFYAKHALGPMMPPSCLCCGQQTNPITRPVAVKHMELPGIVICKHCRDAALLSRDARTAGQAEPVLGTKTWFDGEKVITQHLTARDIYKDQPAPQAVPQAEAVRVLDLWIELVKELCPDGIEQTCDECGGDDDDCPGTCVYRSARAMLAAAPKPQEPEA